MKLLRWFLTFFQPTLRDPRRPKFVEGTEWRCPHCDALIAIARRDIFVYNRHRSSDWDVKDFPSFRTRTHCGAYVMKHGAVMQTLIYTPTGWVG